MSALARRAAVAELLKDRGDLLVVTGLGAPTYDVAAAGDDDRNYYLWGAMGAAAMVGLGVARAQPDARVLVITGDGEMLMGLGALATIAVAAPSNLTIAVLDNGEYGETGGQESHAGRGVRLDRIAAGAGFADVRNIENMADVAALREGLTDKTGPTFARIAVAKGEDPRVMPSRDGVLIKNRFRAALAIDG